MPIFEKVAHKTKPYLRRLLKPSSLRVHGVDILMDYDRWSPRMVHLLSTENYEASEARAIRQLVEPNDRVADIGGGIGFSGSLAAQIVGSANLAVYEANPEAAETIRRTLAHNSFDSPVHNYAVVDDDYRGSSIAFNVSAVLCASSTLDISGESRKIEVPVIRFGEILRTFRPTVVLMDIEGAEYGALMKSDLVGVSKLCVEVHPAIIGDAQVTAVVRRVIEQGFLIDFALSTPSVITFKRKADADADAGAEAPAAPEAALAATLAG